MNQHETRTQHKHMSIHSDGPFVKLNATWGSGHVRSSFYFIVLFTINICFANNIALLK